MERQTHTIDARNRSLGRVAVEVATFLRGKQRAQFVPYKDEGDFVVVKNITQIRITGRKETQKFYYRHSGYPGGIHAKRLREFFEKDPKQVLRLAVLRMLPNNRLRGLQIKRLKIEE
ncbi:MAG: 50S ribosomal protein L13 [Candidatus Wildermuthbacteria bacterium]|nr:50S ribosomal protein L13 [Candidatus Wildermuthbacteria bacterium]